MRKKNTQVCFILTRLGFLDEPGPNLKRSSKPSSLVMQTSSVVNLTPHSVNVVSKDGDIATSFAPSGTIARVSVAETAAGVITVPVPAETAGETWSYDIPLITSTYGDVTGLPEPIFGTVYIVSAMVRLAVPTRRDVVSPAGLVRDGAGMVIGCRQFERNR